MPLRHRQDYAVDLYRGLPTGDINQPKSSRPVMKERERTAIQPTSTGLELADSLEELYRARNHPLSEQAPISCVQEGPSELG